MRITKRKIFKFITIVTGIILLLTYHVFRATVNSPDPDLRMRSSMNTARLGSYQHGGLSTQSSKRDGNSPLSLDVLRLDSNTLKQLSRRMQLPPMLQFPPEQFFVSNNDDWANNTLLYGDSKGNPGFLTIGIASVERRHGAGRYLYSTIDSLIKHTSDQDKQVITIVVFLSDINATNNVNRANQIYQRYSTYCDSGFLQVIHSPINIYPKFELFKRTYFDTKERVVWRSKQNIDYAYLLSYSYLISTYYMQLEDDVFTTNGFLKDIQTFIQTQKELWSCLEFSQLGFIGKLFKSNDLVKLAKLLLLHYDVQPCDILLGKFLSIQRQHNPIHYKESLFQHFGRISSLQNKLMPVIDSNFKNIGEFDFSNDIPKGDNPPAEIHTNMGTYEDYYPELAYTTNQTTSKYFWANTIPRPSYYRLKFYKPLNVSRIIIFTGDGLKKQDTYGGGEVKVGTKKLGKLRCELLRRIGTFNDGEFDSYIQGFTIPHDVTCISIESRRFYSHWIIIRKISVFVYERNK